MKRPAGLTELDKLLLELITKEIKTQRSRHLSLDMTALADQGYTAQQVRESLDYLNQMNDEQMH